MRSALESEKKAAARQFAVRDKQLERMTLSLAGMYGDLQGLVGPSLPTVEGLALPEPEAAEVTDLPQLAAGTDEPPAPEVH